VTGHWWKPEYAEKISHACHKGSWAEVSRLLGSPEHLIMPVFFLDEWRPYSQRSTLITGVYMYLSNSKSVSCINIIYMYDETY
jgi:hypothetical protein